MAKKEAPEKVSVEEAAKVLEDERNARTQEFVKELQVLCTKYNCDLTSIVQVVAR